MARPSFDSLVTVLGGWLFAPRRTVSGAILASQWAVDKPKHYTAYHRLFAKARWSIDAAGLMFLKLVLPLCGPEVFLVVDDTLCSKTGRNMYGVGMHYNAALTGKKLSNAKASIKSKGHCWVTLGVAVEFSWRKGHRYCLPILMRLYLNSKTAERDKQPYFSRPQLAIQMLKIICQAHPDKQFHLLGDSGYGGQNVLQALPTNCQLTVRWINNAALHEPAPVRVAGTKGRPRVRGKRLAGPTQMLDTQTGQTLTLDLYGRHDRCRVVGALACLYTTPKRLLQILAVEPLGKDDTPKPKMRQTFYSTHVDATPQQVLQWYAMRWSIEVTFHDAKQLLGFDEPQGWSKQSALRQAPTLMLMYNLIVLWFAREGYRQPVVPTRAWYRRKTAASFADMVTTLRCRSTEGLLTTAPANRLRQNPLQSLFDSLRTAA